MKKRLFAIILGVVCLVSLFAACSGSDDDANKTYKVVYDFEGEEDIELIVPVRKKPTSSSIPEVEQKLGYDAKWEEFDYKKVKKDEVVTLKPVYTAKTYTITYNANGGKAIDGTTSVTYDAPYTLETTTKTGYEFMGWTVGSGQNQKEIAVSGEKWQEVSDITLKAVWRASVYTITYNVNGGEALEPDQVTYDSAYVLKTPTREGYVFTGWFIGTGVSEMEVMVEGSRWNKLGDLTLNAKWREKGPQDYTVTFKQQGKLDVVLAGDELSSSSIPLLETKVGYKAGTWNLDGSVVDFNTLVVNKDLIITAVYEAKEYTLKFVYKGGKKISDLVVKYDAPYSLPSYSQENTGLWKAEGWVYENRLISENGTWQIDGEETIEITLKNPKIKVTFIQKGLAQDRVTTYYVDYGTNFLQDYELPELVPVQGAIMVWYEKNTKLLSIIKDVTIYGGAWDGDSNWSPSA